FYWGKGDFTFGNGEGEFRTPMKIAVDSIGNVYVVDYGNGRVQVLDESGEFLRQIRNFTYDTEFGPHTTSMNPWAIAIDQNDQVYVLDYVFYNENSSFNQAQVVVFNSHGDYAARWGSYGNGEGQFKDPRDVAVDRDGHIYVADTGNHRIQKFNASMEYVTEWSIAGNPSGIDVDRLGNVYVTDSDNHRVLKFDSVGN